MSSDSGMTPERAKEVLSGEFKGAETTALFHYSKGFLQGVAYQEEKAKGLVEALKYYASDPSGVGNPAKAALAKLNALLGGE